MCIHRRFSPLLTSHVLLVPGYGRPDQCLDKPLSRAGGSKTCTHTGSIASAIPVLSLMPPLRYPHPLVTATPPAKLGHTPTDAARAEAEMVWRDTHQLPLPAVLGSSADTP